MTMLESWKARIQSLLDFQAQMRSDMVTVRLKRADLVELMVILKSVEELKKKVETK